MRWINIGALLGLFVPSAAHAEVDNLDILSRLVPVVAIADGASDRCWTNVSAVKDAAELSLRRAYEDVYHFHDNVGEEVRNNAQAFFYVNIVVDAARSKSGTDFCYGGYDVHFAIYTELWDKWRLVSLHREGGYAINRNNLNDVVRTFVQEQLDHVALAVLRYRAESN